MEVPINSIRLSPRVSDDDSVLIIPYRRDRVETECPTTVPKVVTESVTDREYYDTRSVGHNRVFQRVNRPYRIVS